MRFQLYQINEGHLVMLDRHTGLTGAYKQIEDILRLSKADAKLQKMILHTLGILDHKTRTRITFSDSYRY